MSELPGFTVAAADGTIGAVRDVCFDDRRWLVRYVRVTVYGDTAGRDLLIAPMSVIAMDWIGRLMYVRLTQRQLLDGPRIDPAAPMSRQDEIDFYNYHGYADYWQGTGLAALTRYPIPWVGAYPDAAFVPGCEPEDLVMREREELLDIEAESAGKHARSSNAMIGYQVVAADGPIGRLENFLFDERSWTIGYLVVGTRHWLRYQRLRIAPDWVEQINWSEREIIVDVGRRAAHTSPTFNPSDRVSHVAEATDAASTSRLG